MQTDSQSCCQRVSVLLSNCTIMKLCLHLIMYLSNFQHFSFVIFTQIYLQFASDTHSWNAAANICDLRERGAREGRQAAFGQGPGAVGFVSSPNHSKNSWLCDRLIWAIVQSDPGIKHHRVLLHPDSSLDLVCRALGKKLFSFFYSSPVNMLELWICESSAIDHHKHLNCLEFWGPVLAHSEDFSHQKKSQGVTAFGAPIRTC